MALEDTTFKKVSHKLFGHFYLLWWPTTFLHHSHSQQFWGTCAGLSKNTFWQKFEILAVSHFLSYFYNGKIAPECAKNGTQTFFSKLLRKSV